MKHLITYIRVSPSNPDPSKQRAELAAYCASSGLTIDREYIDTEAKARPAWDALMRDCKAGEVGRILMTRMGRAFARFEDFVLLEEKLKALGVTVRCVLDGIDTDDKCPPYGNLVFVTLAILIKYQKDMAAERRRDAVAAAKVRGVSFGRRLVAPVPDWETRLAGWNGTDYKELIGLLGVSKSTAWRLARKRSGNSDSQKVSAAPAAPSTLAAEF